MDSLKDDRNIVSIYDHIVNESEDETVIYILMEYLQPAQDWFAAREFSEISVLQLGIQLCNALEACSEKGILHRDLKPENILVTEDGTFKLSDFGVSEETGTGSLSMTPQGTVAYMAPEILKGKPYTMEAGIYSLGLILYQLVNRNYLPFISTDKRLITPADYAHSVECRCRGDKFPIPKDASLELVTILSKSCKFDEKQRYHSVAELRKDLQKVKSIMERRESAMSGEKNKNSMAKKIGIILAVLALCGGVAYAAPRMLHKSQPENAPIQESESLTVAETEAATIEEVASSMEETESEKVTISEKEEDAIPAEEAASEPGTEEVTDAEAEEAKEEKRYEIGDTVTGDYYQATLISSVVNHESIPEILYDFDLEQGECFVTYTVEVKNLTGKSQVFKDTNFALYAEGEECTRQFPMKEFVNIRIDAV